ncbi:NADH-quinone oxidoreductase subunit L [Desulfovibrio sp. OttesenSCG-928-A18]|nr:NADH-quinone oxidoreductase subunit L [Desulfovibrio sp. OttesenSCG-928-A18]
MLDILIFFCIIFPVIAGGVAFLDKGNSLQKRLLRVSGIVLVIASVLLAFYAPATLSSSSGLAPAMKTPIIVLDFALLALIFYIGFRRRHNLIMMLAAAQFAGMLILEWVMLPGAQVAPAAGEAAKAAAVVPPAFVLDSLAATMVLIVSVIGSLIAWYAIGYMKEHEEHLQLGNSAQPRFFAVILLFLGAMNGLALADDLTWVYFFWEVTTLCSFLLIGHDDTAEANKNAERALWMNMAGGLAFVVALLYLQQAVGTLSITFIAEKMRGAEGLRPTLLLIPMVALCFAGFTKSAQAPFQSWLTGAMVAPTPVSALLHSSTMVKAGVYLVLRLAPLYAASYVSTLVAICGAFTFIAMAALAAGQSNGKKILAYSTISNLGLIIACAGINTAASLAAGMMLLIFHAVSKALLFLCVGSIEQKIGSRDIEDMRGLFSVMPRTALLTTFGIITMMLPPFGMLLAKWMALESAVEASAMPILVAMLALGSGLTVLFWARWAGIMLGSANARLSVGSETMDTFMGPVLRALAWGAAIFSFFAPIIYIWLVEPAVHGMVFTAAGAENPLAYVPGSGGLANSYGVFAVYPIYLLLGLGFWYAWRETKKHGEPGLTLPYLSGLQTSQDDKVGFIGPMKGFVEAKSGNYYLSTFFGEDRISKTVNTVAIALLVMLLGGVLQ